MKKILSFLLMPLLCLNAACKGQKQKAVTDNKSLLWRISGKGLSRPSYLFGTIHMLCPGDYFWTDAMRKSLSDCKEVCFEMDMDDPAVLRSATEGIMGTGAGKKLLKDYFTDEDYAKVALFARDSFEMDLSDYQQMTPMGIQALFEMKMVSCIIPVSYEANIMEEARRQQIDVTGLETPEEQINVLNSVPDDSVVKGLVQMADSPADGKIAYQKMLAAYKDQDLPGLYNQIQAFRELGDALGVFLDDRNVRWVPRMNKRMARNAVFFAVGAGHLWGDRGVITLLRNAGYTVEAIK